MMRALVYAAIASALAPCAAAEPMLKLGQEIPKTLVRVCPNLGDAKAEAKQAAMLGWKVPPAKTMKFQSGPASSRFAFTLGRFVYGLARHSAVLSKSPTSRTS